MAEKKQTKVEAPSACAFPKCPTELAQPPGSGRRRRWCSRHAVGKHRTADLRKAAAKGDQSAKVLLEQEGASQEVSTSLTSRIQRLAIALSSTPDLLEAAELAGLGGLPVEELKLLEARARAEHDDLVGGRLRGVTSLSNQALALLFVRLRDSASSIPANQVAGALKSAATVAELLLGGAVPTFASVEVVLDLGDASGPPPAAAPEVPAPEVEL